ncbi:uncharacterized protein LOC128883657 isoform X2 [Hylaeus volcanicus]|uniref:uncharacterized protein LOC128883657 isoform X2 n=1 Tax=Hylaeus volcanicus TaxID=313075 RepID=UPI0023B87882|nr:uncharacterized protein LOC128883657 isoform X2 [Hylaeus volcanicus]
METTIEVTSSECPQDFISHIEFLNADTTEEKGNLLVSSWDSTVSLYNSSTGRLTTRCSNFIQRPILSCCTCDPIGSNISNSNDTYRFITGNLDGQIFIGDFKQCDDTPVVLGKHEKAVATLGYFAEQGLSFDNCVLSFKNCYTRFSVFGKLGQDHEGLGLEVLLDASVDKTPYRNNSLCFRNQKLVHTIPMNGKVFSLAICNSNAKLVLCDSEKTVTIYDIRNLSKPESVRSSAQPVLKYQLRHVACFPDATGYAVASVEGRVAWEYFDATLGPNGSKKNYAFKCHREKEEDNRELIFPVNKLAFNYKYNSFATGGGDATTSIWDGYNKKRLWKSSKLSTSENVSGLCFDRHGLLLAIGLSNGRITPTIPRSPSRVIIRHMKPEDVSPRVMKKE